MPDQPEPPGKLALQEAAEFIKYTLTIGAGALAFSVDLITKNLPFTNWTKWALVTSWIFLVISIGAGVLVWSRIPIQLAGQNYNLEDRLFTLPGKIHQVLFVLGVLSIGVAIFFYAWYPAASHKTKLKQGTKRESVDNVIAGRPPQRCPPAAAFSPVFSPTFSPVFSPSCCYRCSPASNMTRRSHREHHMPHSKSP